MSTPRLPHVDTPEDGQSSTENRAVANVQRRGAIPASRLATIAKRPEVKHRVNRQKGDWHRWAIVVENPHEDDEAADERGVTRWSKSSRTASATTAGKRRMVAVLVAERRKDGDGDISVVVGGKQADNRSDVGPSPSRDAWEMVDDDDEEEGGVLLVSDSEDDGDSITSGTSGQTPTRPIPIPGGPMAANTAMQSAEPQLGQITTPDDDSPLSKPVNTCGPTTESESEDEWFSMYGYAAAERLLESIRTAMLDNNDAPYVLPN
ncbi:hypothetical protein BZA05DRAFT_442786 [Tricharina praecox]|uniref:uncharacterized protein n=1 Tax=Tricharina praecox TaxID=43433 RepID=UPI0022209405|nr:uncharacterized protein BZA05DRAFT_442786 [Tricharina praecox]KAI5856128.1 hypothetical protein BZA05DRAFT_442786 [Tricharina praecox]